MTPGWNLGVVPLNRIRPVVRLLRIGPVIRWGSIIPYFSMRQCKEGFNDYNGFTEKTDGIG